MKSFKLDPPKSLAQKVVGRLSQAIIEGDLPLGSIIAEETLAQSFGVSRTPVREALNQLQLQGLVVIRPQVGSFVFSPDAEDIATICQFRIILEPKAAQLAYHHDREGTLGELAAAIAEMELAVKARDNVAYGHADTALHDAFFNRCANRYLQEAYRLVGLRVAALRTNLSAPIDVQTPVSFEQHRDFMRHFASGDFEAFETLMTSHILGSGETYIKALQLKGQ
jgi:DNA-binding GntR family transcriptional regulator